jgi:4-azaleucine resistance transporter AzlC
MTIRPGRGWQRGMQANIPLAISAMAYGGVFGVLSGNQGVSWAEMLAMDLLLFAGSAQLVMIEMWHGPLPVMEMGLAVLVINMRYLLIGASLQPVFDGRPLWKKALGMHLVADENWAVTIAAQRAGGTSPAFLVGGGVLLLAAWTLSTVAGNLLGGKIPEPATWGLDFAFVAVFAALTLSLWQGRSDFLPWLAAAILAVIGEQLLPGKLYIALGGVGGALTAAVLELRRKTVTSAHPRPGDRTLSSPPSPAPPSGPAADIILAEEEQR